MKEGRFSFGPRSCALGLALLWPRVSIAEDEATVVVHGSRAPGSATEPELAVGSVQGEALREPGADAADVLTRAAGVQVTRRGSSADLATVSIRGAEASQIPVYLAGIRVNDDVTGVADLSRLPLWMMHRVQIYRGASPLEATRGGMSGALFFEPALPKDSQYRLGAEAGSFGAGALWLGATMEHSKEDESPWATSIAVRRSGAQNDFEFPTDQGTAFVAGDDETEVRRNADFSETDVWLLSRGRAEVGDLSASISAFYNRISREQGVSGLSLVPAMRARSEIRRDLFGVSSRTSCGWGKRCSVLAASGFQATRLFTFDPDAELNLGAEAVEQLSRRASQNLRLSVSHHSKLQTTWGAASELSQLELDVPDGPLVRASEAFVNLNSSLKFAPTRDRSLRAALVGKCVEAHGTTLGEMRSWSQCRPEARLGAHKAFVDRDGARVARLRALVHSGIRFPTLGERFGVSAVTRGNPDLEVERAMSVDLGGTWEPTRTRFWSYWMDLSVFHRNASDLIAYRRSALGYVRPFNVGQARFYGAEVTGEIDAHEHVRHRSTITLLDPRDTTPDRSTENDLLVFRSQITASEELELYHHSRGSTVSHAGVSTYLTYRSGRVADPAGLIVIPQQAIIDLGARLQFVEQVDVRARLENLLGTARYDSLGFPLPGRSFFLSLEIVSR